jgi:predicted O-methyltransferase YrrM
VRSDKSWSPTSTDLDWIEATSRPPNPVFLEMEEEAEGPERIPILSRDSGRLLATLAATRRRVLEIGTAIGYSTLWTAIGLPSDGTIVTIDPDRARTARARAFWRSAGVPDSRITVINAPALEAFAGANDALAGPFDMVFIDALKDEYLAYLAAITDRLAPGAMVVADNVLWSGRTSGARPSKPGDGSDALREFCARVCADPAFETTILPIGDGLLVAALRP